MATLRNSAVIKFFTGNIKNGATKLKKRNLQISKLAYLKLNVL